MGNQILNLKKAQKIYFAFKNFSVLHHANICFSVFVHLNNQQSLYFMTVLHLILVQNTMHVFVKFPNM